MSAGVLTAIIAVAAVAALGLLMRRAGPTAASGPVPDRPPEPPAFDESWVAEGEEDDAEPAALTSDGWAFMPVADPDRVKLVPPLTPHEMELVVPRAPTQHLQRGDLIAARIRRGAPDHDPWRVEALGRDREYRAWRFETEDAARAALALLVRSIVRPPSLEEGPAAAIGEADFAEAKRREEEIERELAAMPDVEGEDPGRRPIG